MEKMMKNQLQYFAEAGTVVNATNGYVNANTGETAAFAGSNSLAPELKAYYDTELLENARAELFYAQFAKRQPLPANHHGTVEWRKWNTFERAPKLTEGVIPTGQKFGVTTVTGSVDQYGTYTSITDKLELRAYDDVILGATEEMGASAAETQEKLIRDALLVGTNVLYCDNIDKSTGAVKSVPTSCATMGASDNDGWSLLTPAMINKAVTVMKKNRVPRIDGKYYAVVHPSVAHDLRESEGWIEAHKYAAPDELLNGEIGELHGVRFIENVFAPVLGNSDEYVNKNGGRSYATYFFGKDSFGIIDPEGGALEMIIHDKGEIGGPLNQFSTIGYKFETNGATILYPERLLRVMSTSSFSAVDEVN
jgi:N4-gp56 family major capsid protein